MRERASGTPIQMHEIDKNPRSGLHRLDGRGPLNGYRETVLRRRGLKRRIVFCPHRSKLEDWIHIEFHMASAQEKALKNDHASCVAALTLAGRSYVVKQYRARSFVKALRRGWGPSRAHMSWNKAQILRESNVPIAPPVAWVEDRMAFFCTRSYFVSQSLQGMTAREYFQQPGLADQNVRNVLAQMTASLRRMHEQGLTFGDTKDTNILIHNGCISWVDYDAVAHTRSMAPVSRRACRDWQILQYNWRHMPHVHAMFVSVLNRHVPRQEFLQLLKSFVRYAQRKQQEICPPSGFVFDPRPFQQAADDAGADRAYAFQSADMEQKLCSPASHGDAKLCEAASILHQVCAGGHRLEKVRSSQTAFVVRAERDGTPLYCKVFLPRTRWEKIKSWFRGTRCRRAVVNKQLLRTAGFNAAEVLSWDEKGGIGVMVTRAVPGQRLDVYWDTPKGALTHADKRRHALLLEELGRQAGRLHACGFGHGDLRLSNILVTFSGEQPVLHFLDNERTRFYARLPRKMIIKNLTQINFDTVHRLSAADRLRIFKAYLRASGFFASPAEQRDLLLRISKRTQKRLNIQ